MLGYVAPTSATWHKYARKAQREQHMAHFSTRLGRSAVNLAQVIALVTCCRIANITAWAGDLEDGFAAARKGDFASALKLWKPLAEHGDAYAQYNIGMMYANGQGVAQDYKIAAKWYALAAEKGDPDSQYNLGVMYANGIGVVQDYKTAIKLYTLSAEQDFADAQYNLGQLYLEGQGVARDYKTAFKWYILAAKQGYSKAQSNLGMMYSNGQGVAQDYVKAHMWFNIAAIDGNSKRAAPNRDDVAKKMTSVEIAQAQELAARCTKSNYKDCD